MNNEKSQNFCGTKNKAVQKEAVTPKVLVRRYASAVLAICLANTKNLHDSEDIMQDVFLKAFTKLNTLKDPARARSWLLQITRRMCIDYHRKSQPTRAIKDDISAPTNTRTERINRLHSAISQLPQSYREPITLYYLDGRKCADVAQSLGISEEAVRSRLVRARLRLHELLTEDSL